MKRCLFTLLLTLISMVVYSQEKRWQGAADAFLKTQMHYDEFFEGNDRLKELYDVLVSGEPGRTAIYLEYLQAVWEGEFGAKKTPAWDKVLAYFEKDPLLKAAFLMDYATFHARQNTEDHTVLLNYMKMALGLMERAGLETSYLYIQSLRDYASALAASDQVNDRLNILNRALTLTEDRLGKDHELYADLLSGISYHYSSIGNLELAAQFSEKSERSKRDHLGVNLPYHRLFDRERIDRFELLTEVPNADLIRMAWLFRYGTWLGHSGRQSPYRKWLATLLYKDWMADVNGRSKPFNIAEIKILISKGQLDIENEQHEEAIQTILEAKQKLEKLLTEKTSYDTLVTYYNTLNLLGCAYYYNGKYGEAGNLFKTLHERFATGQFSAYDWTVKAHHNLVLSLARNSDKGELRKVLKPFVDKKHGITLNYNWKERTELYADLLFEVNDHVSACTLYEDVYKVCWSEAYRSWERQKEENPETDEFRTYSKENMVLNIGPEGVVSMIHETAKPYGDNYTRLLKKLAREAILADKYDAAATHSAEYINEYYDDRETAAIIHEIGTDLRDIYDLKEELFPVYDLFLEAVMEDSSSSSEIVAENKMRSFAHVLDAKANLQYQYRHMRKVLETSADPSLRKQFEEYKKLQQQYGTQKTANNGQGDLETLKIKLDTLRATLSQRTALTALPSERFVFWQQVREKLKRNEAAVEIKRFKTVKEARVVYAAYVITPESQFPEIVFLKDGDYLEKRGLNKYRNSIQARIEDRTSYNDYWKPIQKHLKNVRKVFLSTDGVYAQINVHTLLNPETGKYLIDDLTIYQVTSTKELPRERDIRKKVKKATLMGRPAYYIDDFNTKEVFEPVVTDPQRALTHAQIASGSISDLPGTEQEVESVAKALRKRGVVVEQYLGAQATEEVFKRSRPDVLHVATHGFWFREDEQVARADAMFNSGLLFAGVKNHAERGSSASEDGILTAYEVQGMNLEGTQLAVLSACETALGHVEAGEGVFGLQRAFSIAGVEKVIMSLWKVDDQATRLLFESFYRNWLSGKRTVDEAFRLAQQEIKSTYTDPYYWGAFVLVD